MNSAFFFLLLAAALMPTNTLALEGSSPKLCTEPAAEIYERISPAVALVKGTSINPYAIENRVSRSVGSGVLIDPIGVILTNFHVVFGNQILTVTLKDGTTVPANPTGFDPIFDLALLRIQVGGKKIFPTAKLGDSSRVKIGDVVLAIGHPLGFDQTLTQGTVSAINRVLPETPLSIFRPMIQTDTPINPGNSGGPLLNTCGEVIGINTGIIAFAQNIGFAIPSNLIKTALPSLLKHGRIIRPWVGFHGQLVAPLLEDILRIPLAPGLLVEVVEPESPADRAGIRGGAHEVILDGTAFLIGGDVITKVNGQAIDTPEKLGKIMRGLKVGDKVRFDLLTHGTSRMVEFTLPERPLLPSDIPTVGVLTPLQR